jgi:hypothetical protein
MATSLPVLIMSGKGILVKKYVVRLSAEEREQLDVLIRKGKSPAQRLLKARILLKADASGKRGGWSDSRIVRALDTSASTVYRVRQQLVEEGFEAVLSRKQRATPAIPRIFDGGKEAKLIAETRPPIAMKPQRPARFDYEYERNGTANLFMMFAPLEGWRHIKVTDRHTAVDYARVPKDLSDVHFPQARTIVLVQDNLNIHCKGSLYEAFPAAEARRLVERFEWRFTPKHGSGLDLAESELGVLSSQCLDRRIPDKHTLIDEIAAWEHDRNANHATANWHFTTPNDRVKLKHLYPSI